MVNIKSDCVRLIGLVCGVLCFVAGIVTIILGNKIQGTSFFVYNGAFLTSLGVMFMVIPLSRRDKSEKAD